MIEACELSLNPKIFWIGYGNNRLVMVNRMYSFLPLKLVLHLN